MKYEWKTVSCESTEVENHLNGLSAGGWEVFTVAATATDLKQVFDCFIVARREKQDAVAPLLGSSRKVQRG